MISKSVFCLLLSAFLYANEGKLSENEVSNFKTPVILYEDHNPTDYMDTAYIDISREKSNDLKIKLSAAFISAWIAPFLVNKLEKIYNFLSYKYYLNIRQMICDPHLIRKARGIPTPLYLYIYFLSKYDKEAQITINSLADFNVKFQDFNNNKDPYDFL
jgi:hypothetical protein